MQNVKLSFALCVIAGTLSSCSSNPAYSDLASTYPLSKPTIDYSARLPQRIQPRYEKVVLIDPNVHAWGAYNPDGDLVRAGQATAGSDWCFDMGRPCNTKSGTFRVYSLGSPDCKSTIFPIPKGGAPMPYCMFFNRGQAMHGVHEGEVVDGNISHGCVRMHIPDAEWLRYNFVNVGTKVIVKSY